MRTMNTLRIAAVLAILLPVVPAAWADTPLHGRVSFESGGAMVKGSEDDQWSFAPVNSLIIPGDVLWVDEGERLELELSGGAFVRMADGSKAEVVSLSPTPTLRLWTGSTYVQRIPRSTGDLVLETPAAYVEVAADSQVRVDVVDDGATTITGRQGKAIVRTQSGGSAVISRGQRVYIDPGLLPSQTVGFDTSVQDSFDIWNSKRALALTASPAPKAIPRATSLPVGVYDLSHHGEWVVVDSSYYWRPTTVVEYVPYRRGRWSYVAGVGHVWAGDYPFCYVTSHYGRWRHHSSYGWIWTYRETWSPAWVVSVRYGPNFVWAPLDPWDRPAAYGSAHFTVGSVRISVGASSYAPATQVLVGTGYAIPMTQTVVTTTHVTNINIWNIHAPGRGRRVPDFGTGLPVRDYSPRRVVRGPNIDRPGLSGAYQRVASLEERSGRSRFEPSSRALQRDVRTSERVTERSARVRRVSVDERPGRDPASRAGRSTDESRRAADMASRASTDTRAGATDARDRRGARGTEVAESPHADRSAARDRATAGRTVLPGLRRPDGTTERSARDSAATERSARGPDTTVIRGATPPAERDAAQEGRTTVPQRTEDPSRQARVTGRRPQSPVRSISGAAEPAAPTERPTAARSTTRTRPTQAESTTGRPGTLSDTRRFAPAPQRPSVTRPSTPVPERPSVTRQPTRVPERPQVSRPPTSTPERPTVTRPSAPMPDRPSATQRSAPAPPQRPSVSRHTTPAPRRPSVTRQPAPEPQRPSATRQPAPAPQRPSVTRQPAPAPQPPSSSTSPRAPIIRSRPDASSTRRSQVVSPPSPAAPAPAPSPSPGGTTGPAVGSAPTTRSAPAPSPSISAGGGGLRGRSTGGSSVGGSSGIGVRSRGLRSR